MPEESRYLDFEILKEPWNRYMLEDKTILKLRFTLQKVKVIGGEGGGPNAKMSFSTVAVTEAPDETHGTPGKAYPLEEIQAKVIKPDMSFEPEDAESSLYLLENGELVKVQVKLLSINKSSLFGVDGEPLYYLESEIGIAVLPREIGPGRTGGKAGD